MPNVSGGFPLNLPAQIGAFRRGCYKSCYQVVGAVPASARRVSDRADPVKIFLSVLLSCTVPGVTTITAWWTESELDVKNITNGGKFRLKIVDWVTKR